MTSRPDRGPIRAVLYWLCRLAEAMAIAALIAMTALIAVQIVAREAFVLGLPWADELARYAGLYVIFLTVPILLAHGEHVKIDMFLNMLPGRARRLVRIGNELMTVAFGALFLAAGWAFMLRAGRFSTPAVGLPNFLFYLPAAIGMMLMLFVAIDRSVTAMIAAVKGNGDEP